MVVRVTGIVELCRVQEDEDSPVLCCVVQHVCMYVSPLSPSAPNS